MQKSPDRQVDGLADNWLCSECGDSFSAKVWHCPYCAHHWPEGQEVCKNCRSYGREVREEHGLFASSPLGQLDPLDKQGEIPG